MRETRTRIEISAALLVSMIGCGGSAPPTKSGDDRNVEPTQRSAEPKPEDGSKSETAAPSSGSSAAEELPGAPAPTNVGFDFHGWCYDHGVEANLPVDECEPSGFGKPPADTIWCMRHEDSADGISAYFQSLYVVRAKRLVRLIEIPIAAGTLALVGKSGGDSDRFKVKLSRQNAEEGKSVTFAEDPKLDCAHAAEQVKDLSGQDPKLSQKLAAAVQKVCAARGRYSWNGATLTKVSSKP